MKNRALDITPLPYWPRHRVITIAQERSDSIAVAMLLVLTLIGTAPLWRPDIMLGIDSATQFYPWWSFLGEQLRQGNIPEWNPAQFSGAPFAADLLSGWMYLPAMLIFSILPLAVAAKVFAVFPFLVAGLSTYTLARVLGMNVAGALTAAVAYEFASYFYAASPCCPTFYHGACWLPVMLLGLELALRSRSWLATAAWWSAAGFALSQILAVWPNQRLYYALLLWGSYVGYRTLIAPTIALPAWRDRLLALLWHGGAVVGIALALGAAGWLPRLEYIRFSNLQQGYAGAAANVAGWSPLLIISALSARIDGNMFYAGAVVLSLALFAPWIARRTARSFAVPYFAVFAVAVAVLMLDRMTPLQVILYQVLPGFENLHRHSPGRIIVMFYLAAALLAGATVSSLRRLQLVPALLVLLVAADLFTAAPLALSHAGSRVNLDHYYSPSGAVAFLRAQAETQPFRYVGYDPALNAVDDDQRRYYLFQWDAPEAAALLVNNRASLYGLQSIQGYNPIQPARYVTFMNALNGQSQDYHGTNLLPSGLSSPLLNLLNVRYLIVPTAIPPGRPDLLHLSQRYATVYADDEVRILENHAALPRAWLVHQAQQTTSAAALDLLASGTVDPQQTALLESAPPPLAIPAQPEADQATVMLDQPDRLRVRTASSTAGLLMLSETYNPAWHAYVDGQRVPITAADGALRAIPVPAGTHTVELRYESITLQLGLVISLVAYLALAILLLSCWRRRRNQSIRLITGNNDSDPHGMGHWGDLPIASSGKRS